MKRKISELPGSSRLILEFIRTRRPKTGLEMVNSTLDFNGVIDTSNTTLRIYNSTTRTPFSDPSLPSKETVSLERKVMFILSRNT